MAYAAFIGADPSAVLAAAASLATFFGAFVLADHRDDKGVAAFGVGAAGGVALIGLIPALHAPAFLLTFILSPWRKSPSQIFGFYLVVWAPAIMFALATAYICWLHPSTPQPGMLIAFASPNAQNLLVLAAAPSLLLGILAPKIAGGARAGAVFATLTLATLALLAPAGLPFMTLGAIMFAVEAAWTARLRRGAAWSLLAAALLSAGVIWVHVGQPTSFEAFRDALTILLDPPIH